jgi:hypothetical protein
MISENFIRLFLRLELFPMEAQHLLNSVGYENIPSRFQKF